MNVKISWSIDCNIGAWGVVQSVQFGGPVLCETQRVWESTIGLICYSTSRRLRKLSKEAVYAWDEEPITSSEQTGNCQDHPSRDAYLFLIIFMFCYVLGLNGKCIYHVTLISSDIFRSKWKRSLFVDFLHWAEQITNSGVPAWGYYQDLPTRNAISARRQIW